MAEAMQQQRGRVWVLAVLALGLPSVVFVLSHVLLTALKEQLPESLGLVLAWSLVLTSMIGTLTTAGAVLVAIIGSFLSRVSAKSKGLMWIIAIISVAAFLYLAQVPP
jgi:hypothetical protein